VPELKPSFLSLPEDTRWPTKVSQLVLLFKEIMSITGAEDLEGLIISETTPPVADNEKIWAKVTAAGRVLGFYFYQGAWKPVPTLLQSYTREDLPSEAQDGEMVQLADFGEGVAIYRDGQWTSLLIPKGKTSDRPSAPPTDFRYYDSTIKRDLRWTGSAWTTLEGGTNETRMFTDRALDSLLEEWPGWVAYTGLAGRVPVGEGDDYTAGTTGGRESFTWKVSKRNVDIDTDFIALTQITLDGNEGDAPNNAGYGDEYEVNIMNPYKVVIFLRKETH
jgi:hypothetical protein